jgi:hypothetical protein
MFNAYYNPSNLFISSSSTLNFAMTQQATTSSFNFRYATGYAAGTNITNWKDVMTFKNTGNVGIGTINPGNSRLNVEVPSSDATNPVGLTVTNNYTGASAKFGIDVNVDGAGSGAKYGISSSVIGLASDASANYGYQVAMTPNGIGSCFGVYSQLLSAGSGARYGIYNSVFSPAANTSNIYGEYIVMSGTNATARRYGLYVSGETDNYFSGKIGISNTIPTYNVHSTESQAVFANLYAQNTYNGSFDSRAVYGTAVNGPGYGLGGDFTGGFKGLSAYGNGSTYTGGVWGGIFSADGSAGTRYGVYGQAYATSAVNYGVYGTASSGTTNYALYANGSIGYTGSLLPISDRKFKKDVQPLTGALEKLMKLEPKTYYMKTEEFDYMNFSKVKQFGLIAQEVEEVFPELVEAGSHPGRVDPNNRDVVSEPVTYKGMNYTGLTPVMIQAIKEQQAQIEELKKQLADQQKQIEALLKK